MGDYLVAYQRLKNIFAHRLLAMLGGRGAVAPCHPLQDAFEVARANRVRDAKAPKRLRREIEHVAVFIPCSGSQDGIIGALDSGDYLFADIVAHARRALPRSAAPACCENFLSLGMSAAAQLAFGALPLGRLLDETPVQQAHAPLHAIATVGRRRNLCAVNACLSKLKGDAGHVSPPFLCVAYRRASPLAFT